MAEILGLGVTHFIPLVGPDRKMAGFMERVLKSDKVPEAAKDPSGWPELMRNEWGADRGVTAATEHRRRLVAGFRAARKALDEFQPDFVVMWGDDQYENFREDIIPPFCVMALGHAECRPFEGKADNVWGQPTDKVLRIPGHRKGAKYLASRLIDDDFDMSYAYVARHETGLAHAFILTLLYLDYDQKGWTYPFVPFPVNCYGSNVIRSRGVAAHLDPGEVAEPDPPGPSPRRCFDVGAAVARALKASPWRVALIGSSSWSHAFLTEKTNYIMPDMEADRLRFEELRSGHFDAWRNLTTKQIEYAGQQEFLNWICLAGAMHELGQKAEIVDYVESYVFNSNKCFAIFRPQ
jgi:hypothetical protein